MPEYASENISRARAYHHQPLGDDALLTQDEYAEYTNRSVRTLERERAEGRGCPFVRRGPLLIRYRGADIKRHLADQVRGGERRRGRPPRVQATESTRAAP
jgi:hypothetical protein